MKQKDIQQIINDVIKESVTMGDINRAGTGARIGSKINGPTGARLGANVGYYSRDIATASAAGIVAYALKKLYDKFKEEKDPKKKAELKVKINKVKKKIKAKRVNESYELNDNDLVEIFEEDLNYYDRLFKPDTKIL